MLYKTITLNLLQDRPKLYDRLLKTQTLLPTLDRYASQLRDRHLAWKEQLSQANPGLSDSQIATEAAEFALKELEDCLPPEYPQDETDTLSLDAAMAFIRPSPTA